jgi:CRISPR-associated exonuclease Cas4
MKKKATTTGRIRLNRDDDDYLLISGIQHFAFCRRQWALIHIESQWDENVHTVSGDLMHARAHNQSLTEKRGEIIVTRDMPIFSRTLRVRGKCDVVEFRLDEDGVSIFGRKGLWLPTPVEYKRGKPKPHDADRLQLCAQAICLEEMLLCKEIKEAYLYYGETKRREAVQLDFELRESVHTMFSEMHDHYNRRYTPRVKRMKACTSCSLKDICLPKLPNEGTVSVYIKKAIAEDEQLCESS